MWDATCVFHQDTRPIFDAIRVVKGRALVIAPHSRHCHRRGAQIHGTHQAVSHIPALYLPSRSRYSFTDPERMEGWISPGPGCKEQLAHSWYATTPRPAGLEPTTWSNTLTIRLSRHPIWLFQTRLETHLARFRTQIPPQPDPDLKTYSDHRTISLRFSALDARFMTPFSSTNFCF